MTEVHANDLRLDCIERHWCEWQAFADGVDPAARPSLMLDYRPCTYLPDERTSRNGSLHRVRALQSP